MLLIAADVTRTIKLGDKPFHATIKARNTCHNGEEAMSTTTL